MPQREREDETGREPNTTKLCGQDYENCLHNTSAWHALPTTTLIKKVSRLTTWVGRTHPHTTHTQHVWHTCVNSTPCVCVCASAWLDNQNFFPGNFKVNPAQPESTSERTPSDRRISMCKVSPSYSFSSSISLSVSACTLTIKLMKRLGLKHSAGGHCRNKDIKVVAVSWRCSCCWFSIRSGCSLPMRI